MPNSVSSNSIDHIKLKEWIYQYFSEPDLNAACFHLNIDFDNIRQETRELTTIALIQYCRNHGRFPDLVEYARSERPDVTFPDDVFSAASDEPEDNFEEEIRYKDSAEFPLIPFTNREDEIGHIMSYYASAYYLLDAPAGYGKTELLKELERRFTEDGWEVVYVPIHEQASFDNLIYTLADKFNVSNGLNQAFKLPLEDKLSSALNKKWQPMTEKKEGIALLLDFDKRPSLALISELLIKLIPAMKENLAVSDFATTKHNPFRVILTGRYLAARKEIRSTSIPLKVLQLSPFDYNVIRDSVSKYLTSATDSSSQQLAAHLLFLTGGHPGGIAKTLEMYRQTKVAPDRFLKFLSDHVWSQVIRHFVLDIQDGIDHNNPDLFSIVEKLSIFRYVDYKILENLIQEDKDHEATDQYELADKLTETYLLAWNGRFLQDGITRRLLTIRLRQEQAEDFKKRCGEAMALCKQRIMEPNVQRPEIWIIEYLFQSLQQHADEIGSKSQRDQIAQHFLETELPNALHIFLVDRNIPPEDWRAERYALSQAMEEDWEFRFTVNYYLREDLYNNEPFGKLQQRIDLYFSNLEEDRR